MTGRIYLAAACFALGLSTASVSYPSTPINDANWVCAGALEKSLGRRVASINIEKYRERFLAAKQGAVRQAMFLFPASYDVMKDHLRSLNRKRFGEQEFTEHTALEVRGIALTRVKVEGNAANQRRAAAITPERKQRLLAELEDAGIRFEQTSGTHIRTEKYNIVPSKEGWSELEILVFDGKAVLGADSTVIILSRVDSAKAWGMARSGNPFSFGRNRTNNTFVTSTEFGLMQRLATLYKLPFAVFPLSDHLPIYSNTDAWRSARNWLREHEASPGSAAVAKAPGRC